MDANPGSIQTIVIKTRRQGWLINPGRALMLGLAKLAVAGLRHLGLGRSSGGAGADR